MVGQSKNTINHATDTLLARYRRLWMIEDSFRLIKHNLAVRPIYHFKHERIKAHIGICYLAFALMRHAQVSIKLAQQLMSAEDIKRTLYGGQSSILVHHTTKARYRPPANSPMMPQKSTALSASPETWMLPS